MNQPLAEAIFWIAAAACAVAELAILRWSFAQKKVAQSELVPTASRAGELTWAIIPAIALSLLLVATWRSVEARGAQMEMMNNPATPSMMMSPAQSSAHDH
jgi:hypothetical protein